MKQLFKQFDSPGRFFDQVPRDLEANVEYRKSLHTMLEKDKELQKDFLRLCFLDPRIAFNTCFFTANPRGLPGTRNWPFILRPPQEKVVHTLKAGITEQKDVGINKSRDEGATELVCKTFALYLMDPESYFIVGSRNKDLVDCQGDPYTLMAKIDYALKTMPLWMQNYIGNIDRKEMQLSIPKFGSVIKGETTNESFSAGRRATAMLLDEFGRVKPPVAKSIEGSVHDVTGCVIYSSTHWYGANHPFNQALLKSTTLVVELPWWNNPVKNYGMYKSTDYDIIEIVDTTYYKRKFPSIPEVHTSQPFKLSVMERGLLERGYEGETPKFIADGCTTLPMGCDLRSPWHDFEELKRKNDPRDFACNIWMSVLGSQDSYFNHTVLTRVKDEFAQAPDFVGDLLVKFSESGKILNQRFVERAGRNRLRWWGPLKNLRPFQNRNYVIGCDLSYGSGSSNSVASIMDVNTREIVGQWVCPNTPPDEFMDIVVALARWCGGAAGEAYIIYEANGPGLNVHKRLKWQGHARVYTRRQELAKMATIQNNYGWHSNPTNKELLLSDLRIGISESLKTGSEYAKVIIHDEETIHELYNYVYYENGDIGITLDQDSSSGARARHGDRVIATALALLGCKYQARATKTHPKVAKFGSYVQRREAEQETKTNQREPFYGRV